MADRKQVLEELPFGEENNNQENTDNDMPCNYDYEENCLYSCATVHDFLSLTDEMVETIIDAKFKSDLLQNVVIFLSKPTVFKCFIMTPDIDLELSSSHVK